MFAEDLGAIQPPIDDLYGYSGSLSDDATMDFQGWVHDGNGGYIWPDPPEGGDDGTIVVPGSLPGIQIYPDDLYDLGMDFGDLYPEDPLVQPDESGPDGGSEDPNEDPDGGCPNNADSVDQEQVDRFDENHQRIVDLIFGLQSNYSTTVTAGGADLLMSFSSQNLAEYARDYDFIFNDTAVNEARQGTPGNGASYDGLALLKESFLPDGSLSEYVVENSFPNTNNHGVRLWNWVTLHEIIHQYVKSAGVEAALRTEQDGLQRLERVVNDLVRAVAGDAEIELFKELAGGEGEVEVLVDEETDVQADLPDGIDEDLGTSGGDCGGS